MTDRDLRALFSSNDRQLAVVETFTNRQGQWELTAHVLAEHLQHVTDAGFDPEDLEAPRTNVLVFHGVGGIGKTTLSRKLEAALASSGQQPSQWGDPLWPRKQLVPVRIDLARSAGADFEQVVLTIRLALTRLGRPLPAFDLALKRYWEHTHPGEPLEDYLRRGGLASRFGQVLPQQLQSALADVAQALLLPGTVGSVVGQVTGALVRALREHRQSVQALAGCRRLADLLQAEPDLDALSYYPHLLSWELARLGADMRTMPVILLDAFDETGDRTNRDFERLLQRVVWLIPNAFFIITGRSRLQWADTALQGQLNYTGPAAWPGLAERPGPPSRGALPLPSRRRQVLIGDFSRDDCEDYLARRLTHDGQPLINRRIRQVIAVRSHGLPLHLDLSVMRFLEIRRLGRTPQPAEFDHDFPALIARTLSDLTSGERQVLRSVSLLEAFDVSLATRTAGLVHEGAAVRLIERPFVMEDPFGLWPFHLHALIRSTLRTADDLSDDAWSRQDWQQAAERAHAALGDQLAASQIPDRRLLVGCLRQGLALARDFDLALGWLAEAAWAYVADSVWEPLAPATAPGTMQETAGTLLLETTADALVETLHALARRQHEHREGTVARLTAVTDTGLLPEDLHHMAVYYLAKAQRDLSRSEASRRGMQLVANGGGRLAPAARRGLAHLSRLAGDFPTALQTARALGWNGRHHRIEGDVWWPQGDMHRAATAYAAACTEAEQHAVSGERATCQAQRAFTLAFTDPATADAELDLAEQFLTGLDLRATRLTVHIATLIRDAGHEEVDNRAGQLRAETTDSGITATRATLELALAFHHAVQDNHDGLAENIAQLRDLTPGGDYAYYIDIAHFMIGRFPEAPSPARWIHGPHATRERWRALVIARQTRHVSP